MLTELKTDNLIQNHLTIANYYNLLKKLNEIKSNNNQIKEAKDTIIKIKTDLNNARNPKKRKNLSETKEDLKNLREFTKKLPANVLSTKLEIFGLSRKKSSIIKDALLITADHTESVLGIN